MQAERDTEMDRLLAVIARLRGKDGCPWDREQTLDTLKPCLVEETYEVIEALEKDDAALHCEELGDLLLQIAMHAQIRGEQRQFTFDDVARQLREKLIRRHPHVFGDAAVADTAGVLKNWEVIKAREKEGKPRSLLDGLPIHLPALEKAQRVQSRAARVGFDWIRTEDVLAKVDEELGETREAIGSGVEADIREEIGDLLFSVVNLGRFCGINAEEALRGTIAKFIARFTEVETRLHARGRTLPECSLEEMDAIWNELKREARERSGT